MRAVRLTLALLAVLAVLVFWALQRASQQPRGAASAGDAPATGAAKLAPARAVATEAEPTTSEPAPAARVGARDEVVAEAPAAPVDERWVVRGSLSGPKGERIAGGEVWTWSEETVCDARGEFELVLARPPRRPTLFARAPGLAELEQSFSFPDDAREVRVELVLGPAFRVSGRVLDEDGRGLAGAAVASFYSRRKTATSGADGAFLLDHLDPGRDQHLVYARKEGYVQADARVQTQGLVVEGVELVLRRGTSVEGLVLGSDGAPLAEATLYIGFSPHAFDRLDATSGADGSFRFPSVGAGPQTLVVQHPGHSAQNLTLEVPAQPPALAPLVVRLEPAHWIAGRVEDARGTPLAGVSIAAKQDGEYLELDTVASDAEGRFRLEGLPAEGAGLEFYGTRLLRHELTLERLDHDGLVVVLQRAAAVGGRVLDAATGAPLERFTVHFFAPELAPGEVAIGGYSAQWTRTGYPFTHPDGLWTSADDELAPGAVTGVEVRAEGYAPARNAHVVAELELEPARTVFALERGGSVRGEVLDADGAPVPGARLYRGPPGITPRVGDEDQHRSEFAATDGEGRFVFRDVPAGPTQLIVLHDTLPRAVDGPFEVRAGVEVVRLVQLGRGAVLEGLCLDAAGRARTGVPVRLVAAEPERRGKAPIRERRTDADGAFRFEGLDAGLYRVTQLFADPETPFIELERTVAVAADARTSVRLQPAGRAAVEGQLSLATGKLPARLLVLATREEPDGTTCVRGAVARDGQFLLENLEAGTWEVRATLFRDDGPRTASTTLELGADDRPTVTLELR